jgi:hypothetical protein
MELQGRRYLECHMGEWCRFGQLLLKIDANFMCIWNELNARFLSDKRFEVSFQVKYHVAYEFSCACEILRAAPGVYPMGVNSFCRVRRGSFEELLGRRCKQGRQMPDAHEAL